jgi:hypothetical protein
VPSLFGRDVFSGPRGPAIAGVQAIVTTAVTREPPVVQGVRHLVKIGARSWGRRYGRVVRRRYGGWAPPGAADDQRRLNEVNDIFDLIVRVASGEQTASEQLGIGQDEFVPWQFGTVI